MELSTETKTFAEIISTSINCDNLDNELLDPEYDFSGRENPEGQKDLFDADMDELVSGDFMRGGSPLSEDLEIEKIMEQLESTIQEDIFAGNRNISISNKINSMAENEENLDELNLLNSDIISYINSDDKDLRDSRFDRDDVDKNCDSRDEKSKDLINQINKELEETLQFTDVLCHYVYSDVIVGRDFFKLFCSESVNRKDLMAAVE
ncbi:hypothetical protein Trydic_g6571 [Trypoxylus dichotomus]